MTKKKTLVVAMVLLLALSAVVPVAGAELVSVDLQPVTVFDGPGIVKPMGAEGPDPIIPPWPGME